MSSEEGVKSDMEILILLVDGYIRLRQLPDPAQSTKDRIISFYAKPLIMRLKNKNENKNDADNIYILQIRINNSWDDITAKILKHYNKNIKTFHLKMEYDIDGKKHVISRKNWANFRYSQQNVFTIDITEKNMIKEIDITLSRYYKKLKKPYNKIFATYCDENGIDDENLQTELGEAAADSLLVDFDDNFPFKIIPNTKQERQQFILDLIQKCYDNPDFNNNNGSSSDRIHWIEDKMMNADEYKKFAYDLLENHCVGIFKSEQKKDAQDDALKIVKAIDVVTNRPNLLLFMDSYCRLRMDKLYNNELHGNKNDNDFIDKWSLSQFFVEHGDDIQVLIEKCELQIDNKPISLETLKNGVISFANRVMPRMKLLNPLTTICDDLNQFAMYIEGISNYLSNEPVFSGNGDNYDHSPTPIWINNAYIQPPCHVDVVIIPQCVKGKAGNIPIIKIDKTFYEEDDDDDDDEKEEEEETTNMNINNLWMGYGGIDEGKGYNKPIFEINDIGEYLKNCGYNKNIDYIMKEMDTSNIDFNEAMIKKTFLGMHRKMNIKSYERLIFIVDRRNPDIFKDGVDTPWYSLNNKDWNDKIYCFKPKQSNKIATEYQMLPESLFCLSQQLLLPVNKKENKKQIIGIFQDLNGYMFTLNYHLYSSNTIRVYFGYNGQIQRFFMEDIEKFLPQLFIEKNNKIKQRIDEKRFKQYANYRKFKDHSFDDFIEFFKS